MPEERGTLRYRSDLWSKAQINVFCLASFILILAIIILIPTTLLLRNTGLEDNQFCVIIISILVATIVVSGLALTAEYLKIPYMMIPWMIYLIILFLSSLLLSVLMLNKSLLRSMLILMSLTSLTLRGILDAYTRIKEMRAVVKKQEQEILYPAPESDALPHEQLATSKETV